MGTGCLISKNMVLTSARIFCPITTGKLQDLKFSDFIVQFHLGVDKDIPSAKTSTKVTDLRLPK